MNGPYKYYKTGPPDHDLTALVIQSPEPPSRPSEVLRTSKTALREESYSRRHHEETAAGD